MDEIEAGVKEMLTRAEFYKREVTEPLDYEDLYFCIKTVPDPDVHEQGYPVYLFYSAGYGHMNATRDEMLEAIKKVALRPGDVTVCAYRLNGPERPTCVSVSKVFEFMPDNKTPMRIEHFWPLKRPKKAIDAHKLRGMKITDLRK